MASIVQQRDEKRTTIVLITQFLDEALRADRLVVLHNARIFFDAIPDKAKMHRRELSSCGIFVPSGDLANEISA